MAGDADGGPGKGWFARNTRYIHVLSLADLEAHDPHATAAKPGWGAKERRFLCPLPACAGHTNAKRHRSLAVDTDSGAWHCHRCHESGKLKEWWTDQGEDQPKKRAPAARERARRQARRRFGLDAFKDGNVQIGADSGQWLPRLGDRQPLKGTPGAAYLEARRLPLDLCRRAGVQFSPNYCHDPEDESKHTFPAVVFAIMNEQGKAVAAQGRAINGTAKITFGPRALGVFVTPGALDAPFLTVVEAPVDALSLAQCGLPAVATCGTDGAPGWLMDRFAFGLAVAAHDRDDAGDRAAEGFSRGGRGVGITTYRLRPPAGPKDWNESLTKDGEWYVRDYLADRLALVHQAVAERMSVHTDNPADQVSVRTETSTRVEVSRPTPKIPLPADDAVSEPEAPTEAADAPEWGMGEEGAENSLAGESISEEADPEYIALIGDAYCAALADAMPKGTLRLGKGRTTDDPNRWFLLAVRRARVLRRAFGSAWMDAGGPGRDGDLLAADIERFAEWYGGCTPQLWEVNPPVARGTTAPAAAGTPSGGLD